MKDKICFKIYAYETVEIKERKGIPNKDEILNTHVNFRIDGNNDTKNKKTEKSNRKRAMTKFNTSGNLRKTMTKSTKNIPNLKDKDCLIFWNIKDIKYNAIIGVIYIENKI